MFLVLLLSLLVPSHGKSPCDPLVPQYCLLPFPNSYYIQPNGSMESGSQVYFPPESFPLDSFGRPTDPAHWNTFDGFSVFPMILAYFPNLSIRDFATHWDIGRSLSASSPSVLVNADTGETVPHWGELDESLLYTANKSLMMWPARSLDFNTRYVVGLRNLHQSNGATVEPSEDFKCLRDNTPCKDKETEERRKEFEAVFSVLDKAGFQRESLTLAWDFRTASRHSLTGRLVFARDDALERVSSEGPLYKVIAVQDHYSKDIFRKINAVMSVPLYTTTPFPGAKLALDHKGLPVYQGQTDVTFTVLVPASLANGSVSATEASILQYGHGIFGSQREVESGYLQAIANKNGYVMAACDWWGMSEDDAPVVVAMMATGLSDFVILPDRLTQGMVNALTLMRLMKGRFASDPYVSFDGVSVVNPAHSYFYGNSLGGIIGEVYMAATTDVTRGTLGVNGGPFGLLLPRSVDYLWFGEIARVLFENPVQYCTGLALMNMVWSRLEPNAYMAAITTNPLPNTPAHRVLFQYNLGDAQVNTVATLSVARAAGALMYRSNVQPSFVLDDGSIVNETSFGFHFIADDEIEERGSVAVCFDCGAPPIPAVNRHADTRYDTHQCARHSPLAQEQMEMFFRSGRIVNVCKGPCKAKL